MTFDEAFYEGLPQAFPANSTGDIIAPLWADFDCSVSGSISYRVVTESRILDRAKNDVKQYFPLFGFSVHTVLIVSWNRVPYLNSSLTVCRLNGYTNKLMQLETEIVLKGLHTFSIILLNE